MGDVAVERALVRLQREVRREVAVERGAALEPHRGVRGAAAQRGPEGQRPGLRADDVEARSARGSGRRRRRRRARARRTCRARRPPPRRPPAARRSARAPARRAAASSACSAAVTAPFMSTAPRPCSQPSSRRPDHGSSLHASPPSPTTSTWPLRQMRPGRSPGSVTVRPHSSARGASSPGCPGCARSAARSCDVQLGREPVAGGQLAEPLEHGALVAGHARDPHERRRVVGEGVAVDHAGVANVASARPTCSPREFTTDRRARAAVPPRRHAEPLLEHEQRGGVEAAHRAVDAPSGRRRGRRAARCRARPRPRSWPRDRGARASARCRARRRRRRARDGAVIAVASRSPAGPRPPLASRPNASASRASGTRERLHPAAVDGVRQLRRLEPRGLGEADPHRLLDRVVGRRRSPRPASPPPSRARSRTRACPSSCGGPARAGRRRRGRSRRRRGRAGRPDRTRGPARRRRPRAASRAPAGRGRRRRRATRRRSRGGRCRGRGARPRRRRTPASAWNGLAAERTKTDGPRSSPPATAHATRCSLSTAEPRCTRTTASPITTRAPGRPR